MVSSQRKNIVALRKRLRLSRQEFAKLIGVSPMTVSRWERGKARPSKLSQLHIEVADTPITSTGNPLLDAFAAVWKKNYPAMRAILDQPSKVRMPR